MGSKHTPGPWKATKFNPATGEIDDCYLYVEPGIAVIERKVKGHDQHDIANARLIAAAPDLLEALIKVTATLAWNAHGECRAIHDGPIMPSSQAIEVARAAIAKAKGEEQR